MDQLKKTLKEMEKDLFLGIKNDPILEWVSVAALKKAAREANPNQDINSIDGGSPVRELTNTFTSTVAMAGVNKDALTK